MAKAKLSRSLNAERRELDRAERALRAGRSARVRGSECYRADLRGVKRPICSVSVEGEHPREEWEHLRDDPFANAVGMVAVVLLEAMGNPRFGQRLIKEPVRSEQLIRCPAVELDGSELLQIGLM